MYIAYGIEVEDGDYSYVRAAEGVVSAFNAAGEFRALIYDLVPLCECSDIFRTNTINWDLQYNDHLFGFLAMASGGGPQKRGRKSLTRALTCHVK